MLVGEEGRTMKKISWLMVIIMALFLAGCSNLAAPTATLEASATEATPTQITVTPSMTSTITPELKHTSTSLSPTWTPLPTLDQADKQRLVSDLLSTNGGCRLPCWWGLIPGKTNWAQAFQFLSQLDPNIYITGKSKDLLYAYVQVPTPKIVEYANELTQDFTIRNGVMNP